MSECLFCKIGRREIPAQIVHQDALVTAFRDVDPQAPLHLLVIPNQHVRSAAELGPGNGQLLAAMVHTGNRLADEAGYGQSGYRLVMNVGPDGGMSVPHLHLHVLGGRKMAWPPG